MYEARELTRQEHLAALREAIFGACATSRHRRRALGAHALRRVRQSLPARGLANAGSQVRCVTWGLAASIDVPKNDATIARGLARRFGMQHEYCTSTSANAGP